MSIKTWNAKTQLAEPLVPGSVEKEHYSTEEVKTNKTWIDGKPIYRKVFYSPTNAFTVTTQFVLPNVDIITNNGTLFRKGYSSIVPGISAVKGSGKNSYVTLDWYSNSFGEGTSWWCEYTKTTE